MDSRKWYLLVFSLLVPLALLATAAHAADPLPTLDSEELAFLKLINDYRVQNGVGPLQVSAALQRSSEWMSADMANKNYFSHTDSLGRNSAQRMASFGYAYSPTGENLAAGFGDAQTTFIQLRDACDPDATGKCTYAHRLNMLRSGYKVIGIGRAYNASARYRWYWTTDFGGVVDQTISTNGTTNTTCYKSVLTMPVKCVGGVFTSRYLINGCRSFTCVGGNNASQVLVCNKPGNVAPQYFEMYLQTSAGVPPKVCVGPTCVGGTTSFARSPLFPICIG